MPNYPFRPKSTASLRPGDFWAVPIGGGHFGCGRVIQLKPSGGTGSRVMLLAGLINWLGTSCPTADSIANHRTIAQGQIHLRSIWETGGEIHGYRSIDDDGIEPDRFLSESPGKNCMLQSGYEIVRRANPDEQRTLNVLSTWGYLVILHEAEALLRNAVAQETHPK